MTKRTRHTLNWLCAAALLGAGGCAGKKEEAPAAVSPATGKAPAAEALSQGKPDDVLVTVNEARLTRAETEKEAAQRLRAIQGQMSPDQLAEMRPRMMAYVVDQFIIRSLLLQEADRLGLVAGKEDVDKELEQIGKQLPPGVTVEQIMKESSMGEEQMRDEIVTKIRVERLLAARSTPAEVTDTDVEAFYKEHGDRLMVPENVHARHILIAAGEDDDEAARAAKKAKAEDLRKQLSEGADFAKLALENSDCPSKKTGGDLGRFKRGQMVPEFEEAAFGGKVGEIGPVVETKFGYHIIDVLEHTEKTRVPRKNVESMIRNGRQRDDLTALVQDLKDKAKIDYAPDAPRLPETPPMPMTAPARETEEAAEQEPADVEGKSGE
ncbi:MAG: hypothetical protein FJ225_03920 [Lentisphaerae bacterium]|nr:hypothetical protein [Lentisphaerota bacterium]